MAATWERLAFSDDIKPATEIEVLELGTATYDDVQDFINFFGSRTVVDGGGAITDNGDGTAAVAALKAWCKTSHSDTATGVFFDYAGGNTAELTDLTTNYIFLDYNEGTPQLVVSTVVNTYGSMQDHIRLGTVYRDGLRLHTVKAASYIAAPQKYHMHFVEDEGAHRVSGMIATSTGTRNLSITAGAIYRGIDRNTTLAFDTSRTGTADADEVNKLHDADGDFTTGDVGKSVWNVDDSSYVNVTAYVDSGELTLAVDGFPDGNEAYLMDWWTYWYYDGAAWVAVEAQTQIDNAQYNNIAAGLANLVANRFGVHWVYMDLEGHHFHVIYGQGNYTAVQAEEAAVPSMLPNIVTGFCTIIAKIICQQGTDVLTIAYPWTSTFATSLATDHGSLAGLGDDDHTQYLLRAATDVSTDGWVINEDDMASDDDTKVPTQQSVKAYVDAEIAKAIAMGTL